MLTRFANRLSHLFFPRNCVLCRNYIPGEGLPGLCPRCRDTIELNRPPFCAQCSRPLDDIGLPLCRDCRENRPCFDKAWAACIYTPTVRRLTHLFKYGHKTGLRHDFFRLLTAAIETLRIPTEQFDLVMPVPLHPVRLRERGYNQAALLSGMLSRELRLPHCEYSLIRVRHTRNQAALRKKERWTNIRAAFKISSPSEIDGKAVLLVDDLMTTGATLSAAARVLKEAKARNVAALTLAVAP